MENPTEPSSAPEPMNKVVRGNLIAAALLLCGILLSAALGQREVLIRVVSVLIIQVLLGVLYLIYHLLKGLTKGLGRKVTTKRKDNLLQEMRDYPKSNGQYVPKSDFAEIVAKSLSADGLITMAEITNLYGGTHYVCEITPKGLEYLTKTTK